MVYSVSQSIIRDVYGSYKRPEALKVKTNIDDIQLVAEELYSILSYKLQKAGRKARLQYMEFSNDTDQFCAVAGEHGIKTATL